MAAESKRRRLIASLFVLAVVVCVVTNSPALCALTSGVYSGWNSVMSGIWLLFNDPWKARARIGFAFHVATAIWLGAPAALCSLLVFAAIEKLAGQPVNMRSIEATLISLLVALLLSSVAGLAAAAMAATLRVQVWVHPRFKDALQSEIENAGKPFYRFNYATFVLATSVGLPILAIGSVFAVNPFGPWAVPLIFLGGPTLAIAIYLWFAARILAATPASYLMQQNR